jgi:long-subunit fatty acid transport protein
MGGYFNEIDEVIAGNSFGLGARQMAMGGAGIMSIDGSALFYNPANLARIPRIEFNLGLSYQKFNSSTNSQSVGLSQLYGANDSKTNSRLNSMILSIPYPTYRGSLVFGVGMGRMDNFDRVTKFNYQEDIGGNIVSLSEEAFESGGLSQYAFGCGIDLSPRISFGGALLYHRGKHEFNLKSDLYTVGVNNPINQLLVYKYSGVGAKVGFSLQLSRYLGMGMTVESPTILSVRQDEQLIENGVESYSYAEYDIKKPFVFSSGLVYRLNYLTAMIDMNYIDWSQLAYDDNPDMEMEYNSKFKEYYKDVLKYKLGVEYIFPGLGFSVRGGYFNNPLPYKDIEENGIKKYDAKRQHGYSLGVGLLVDQIMTIDIAYVHGSYENDYYRNAIPNFNNSVLLNEDASYNRIYLTGAYRF